MWGAGQHTRPAWDEPPHPGTLHTCSGALSQAVGPTPAHALPFPASQSSPLESAWFLGSCCCCGRIPPRLGGAPLSLPLGPMPLRQPRHIPQRPGPKACGCSFHTGGQLWHQVSCWAQTRPLGPLTPLSPPWPQPGSYSPTPGPRLASRSLGASTLPCLSHPPALSPPCPSPTCPPAQPQNLWA